METITLTELNELEELGSALTIEGILEDSISDFLDWIKKYTPMKKETVYIIKGKTMNRLYGLTGKNAYHDDFNLVSVKHEDMEDYKKIIMERFKIGGRWFDDIVANNAAKEIMERNSRKN